MMFDICLILIILFPIVYQLVLSYAGLGDYLLFVPRDPSSLFSLNKEGIVSVIGFACIYMFGARVGAALLGQRRTFGQWRRLAGNLGIVSAACWATWFVVTVVIGWDTSRRLANLPYVLFVIGYNLPIIAGLLAVDLAVGFPPQPILYDTINRNQLVLFLLANVMTGAVNMSMRTLWAGGAVGFAVLCTYMGVLCAVAYALHARNITLKFW